MRIYKRRASHPGFSSAADTSLGVNATQPPISRSRGALLRHRCVGVRSLTGYLRTVYDVMAVSGCEPRCTTVLSPESVGGTSKAGELRRRQRFFHNGQGAKLAGQHRRIVNFHHDFERRRAANRLEPRCFLDSRAGEVHNIAWAACAEVPAPKLRHAPLPRASSAMQQFFAHPLAQVVVLVTVTAVLIAIGVYVVGRFRGRASNDQPSPSEHLTKFREMHASGELSDEEFRTIKSQLAQQLQAELSESDKTG